MGNKKVIKKEAWKALFKWAFPILLIIWTVYFGVMREMVIGIISAILTLVSVLHNIGFFPKINIRIPKQKDNSQKDEKQSRCKIWWNYNQWFFLTTVIVLFCLISLFYTVPKVLQRIVNDNGKEKPTKEVIPEQKEDSLNIAEQQQQYNDLVAKYKYRMEVFPSVEEAQKSLKEDSLVVSQIVQLLEQNPMLDSVSKFQYAEIYNNRVDSVMKIIINAVYLPDWNEPEFKYMVETYSQILKEIEQMKINP
jgi:hypothetical protein